MFRLPVKSLQHARRRRHRHFLAQQLEIVPPVLDFDAESRFQLMQMRIEWAAKAGQTGVVRRLQKKLQGTGLRTQHCWAGTQSPRSE